MTREPAGPKKGEGQCPVEAAARVTFLPDDVTVAAAPGDTLLDAALSQGVQMPHACGGNCACTTCHLVVCEGWEHLSPVEEPEAQRLATAADSTPRSRLGCQALVRGGPVCVRIVGTEDEWTLAAR